jgi:hypothetical protein
MKPTYIEVTDQFYLVYKKKELRTKGHIDGTCKLYPPTDNVTCELFDKEEEMLKRIKELNLEMLK